MTEMHLRVLTPSQTVLDVQTSSVILPAADGSRGVLPNHAPMLCALGEGDLQYAGSDGKKLSVRLAGGVAHMENNELTVLTREAEIPG